MKFKVQLGYFLPREAKESSLYVLLQDTPPVLPSLMSLLLFHNTPDKAFPGFQGQHLRIRTDNKPCSCPLYSINLKPPQVTRQDSTEHNLKSLQVLPRP